MCVSSRIPPAPLMSAVAHLQLAKVQREVCAGAEGLRQASRRVVCGVALEGAEQHAAGGGALLQRCHSGARPGLQGCRPAAWLPHAVRCRRCMVISCRWAADIPHLPAAGRPAAWSAAGAGCTPGRATADRTLPGSWAPAQLPPAAGTPALGVATRCPAHWRSMRQQACRRLSERVGVGGGLVIRRTGDMQHSSC